MKRIFIVFMLICVCVSLKSKEYVVFMVRGDVSVVINGEIKPVNEKMLIKDSWEILVAKNSTLMLKDNKKRKMPNINGEKRGILKQIIKHKEAKFLNCIPDIWNYIMEKTVSDYGVTIDDNKKIYMRGSTPRGESDPDSLSFHDTIIKDLIQQAIKDE